MVEIRNVEICGLERAVNAISNSFNVGDIDTTAEITTERPWKVARALGCNMDSHQSHDAYLKGIVVFYDLKGNGCFMPEFQRYHFHELVMSQSTMHSLKKLMTTEGFDPYTKYVTEETRALVKKYYGQWEVAQKLGDKAAEYKALMTLLHNTPRGLELWVTIKSSYLQLKTQVIQRAGHKQVEDWRSFIEFCYSLPRFRELCGFMDEKWNIDRIFPLI